MPARFVCVDHEIPWRMPSDLWEWVPEVYLVHLTVEEVGLIDLRDAKINERGTGQCPKSCAWVGFTCFYFWN